jgi:hypothetical protein
MNELRRSVLLTSCSVVGTGLFLGAWSVAQATEPCDDFDECKVLIEINASDGDIGFHWLGDAGDLRAMRIDDPDGEKIFENRVFGSLGEQKLTETFGESAEPLCWPDPDADPEDLEDIVTLREFRELWTPGMYAFRGKGEEGEQLSGETMLTYDLPAAPQEVDFEDGIISWEAGDDLGNCAPLSNEGDDYAGQELLGDLVSDGIIADPEGVVVAAYEVVLEPDVEDGDPVGQLVFVVRVAGNIDPMQVTVPDDYLGALPENTPVKIEVGAIGVDDNATFTEEDGFCVNEADEGCEEDDE